jgi:hypothetical protein
VSEEALVSATKVGGGQSDSTGSLRLTQAAREGAMEAWLEILSRRHPELLWVAKEPLDLATTRS